MSRRRLKSRPFHGQPMLGVSAAPTVGNSVAISEIHEEANLIDVVVRFDLISETGCSRVAAGRTNIRSTLSLNVTSLANLCCSDGD